MLELQNVSYSVTENDTSDGSGASKEIIKNISLKIEDAFTAITGPNGGGKSTLAKLIAGIRNILIAITIIISLFLSIDLMSPDAISIPVMNIDNGVFMLPMRLSGCSITDGTGIRQRYIMRPITTDIITGVVSIVCNTSFALTFLLTIAYPTVHNKILNIVTYTLA